MLKTIKANTINKKKKNKTTTMTKRENERAPIRNATGFCSDISIMLA